MTNYEEEPITEADHELARKLVWGESGVAPMKARTTTPRIPPPDDLASICDRVATFAQKLRERGLYDLSEEMLDNLLGHDLEGDTDSCGNHLTPAPCPRCKGKKIFVFEYPGDNGDPVRETIACDACRGTGLEPG